MVETVDDGLRRDSVAGGDAVSLASARRERQGWVAIWDARPEGGMGAGTIVVVDPLVQHLSEMVFAEGNDEVETLPADGADEAFAEGVGLGALGRGL